MLAVKTQFEKTALARLADMFDMFMQAFVALGDKDSIKGTGTVAAVAIGCKCNPGFAIGQQ